jgi:hypothetical protein
VVLNCGNWDRNLIEISRDLYCTINYFITRRKSRDVFVSDSHVEVKADQTRRRQVMISNYRIKATTCYN